MLRRYAGLILFLLSGMTAGWAQERVALDGSVQDLSVVNELLSGGRRLSGYVTLRANVPGFSESLSRSGFERYLDGTTTLSELRMSTEREITRLLLARKMTESEVSRFQKSVQRLLQGLPERYPRVRESGFHLAALRTEGVPVIVLDPVRNADLRSLLEEARGIRKAPKLARGERLERALRLLETKLPGSISSGSRMATVRMVLESAGFQAVYQPMAGSGEILLKVNVTDKVLSSVDPLQGEGVWKEVHRSKEAFLEIRVAGENLEARHVALRGTRNLRVDGVVRRPVPPVSEIRSGSPTAVGRPGVTRVVAGEVGGAVRYTAAYFAKEGLRSAFTLDGTPLRDAVRNVQDPDFVKSLAVFSGGARLMERGVTIPAVQKWMRKLPGNVSTVTTTALSLLAGSTAWDAVEGDFDLGRSSRSALSYTMSSYFMAPLRSIPVSHPAAKIGLDLAHLTMTLTVGESYEKLLMGNERPRTRRLRSGPPSAE